jgi:Ca2+-binding RTX toxin-like protein
VQTAAVQVSGSTLVVTAAAGAKDNLAITRPSASVLRVTDLPGTVYTGSGVHAWAGCTRSGDYSADCNASGITLIQVTSGDQIDKVVNSTTVRSSLYGGGANDVLTGGSANDTLIGGPGAEVMKGMNGNDQLLARDGTSDTTINCDGGGSPGGGADKADLDLLPMDPNSAVTNCETKTRH